MACGRSPDSSGGLAPAIGLMVKHIPNSWAIVADQCAAGHCRTSSIRMAAMGMISTYSIMIPWSTPMRMTAPPTRFVLGIELSEFSESSGISARRGDHAHLGSSAALDRRCRTVSLQLHAEYLARVGFPANRTGWQRCMVIRVTSNRRLPYECMNTTDIRQRRLRTAGPRNC